jgi:hypothetical protein
MRAKVYRYGQAVKRISLNQRSTGRFDFKYEPFGSKIEEYDQEEYAKHLEIERIKRSYEDMQTSHPLLLEL